MLLRFLSLLIFLPVFAYSQTSIELRYGMNRAIWRIDDRILEDNTYTLDRIISGIGVDIPITKMFSIKPEIGYVQKGNRYIQQDTSSKENFIDKMNYIELPVQLKFNLHYEQFTFYLSAGPNFSYAINGTNYYSRLTKTDYYQQEVKINFSDDIFRKAEVGILLGTGVSLPIWKLRLGVDVRYSNSLTNLLDENSQYPFKAFNKGIQLCGLVGIPLSWD
ncbi:MAG: PorT family protein [Saprospiraceae bacterium]|nr:PorT family protein [Saprospiraceae bacterium]